MSEQQTPKYGRAFNAAVSADWLITEDGLRNLLAIAARIPTEKAVEAQDSPPLEYTRIADIRDGVAIIPVDGPIFRYANLFTWFSGGSSVDVLAKDFNAALENSSVHAIMFEINSPGGEVTGINEFTEMIFNARSKKPMTARVGGYGCSAAYWIASACGDIVCDDTAQLGSIGVMAVYTDDRKMLEAEGLEEIEFISSQSPYKNSPPWTDEGKKRIQARIDALAQVFVEKIARNRDVSVETVLKDFGQGDVFVGQAAIDAGLADCLGSFEDTLYALAKTHNPYFIDARAEANEKTIKFPDAVSSEAVEINSGDPAAEQSQYEESMKEETKGTEPETAVTEPGANEPSTQPEPATNSGAVTATTPEPKAASDEMAGLREKLDAAQKANEEQAKRIAALEQEATNKWIAEQVADFAGETEAHMTVLGALVKAHGKDGAETKAYIELQKAQSAQIEKGGLFKEIGKGGAETDNSVEAQLEAKAQEILKNDPKLTIQQARTMAYEQNPGLYAQL
ncbi:MAG: S49 family peptidase [Pyrinomonadaceae bacterium]